MVADCLNYDNLTEFKEQFKVMLVRRHYWNVTSAFNYDSPALELAFKEELTPRDAYFKIFNVKPDYFKGSGVDDHD